MAASFNADEILEMAEQIERNGAKFYREASKVAEDKQISQMFLDMAVMEEGHLRTFEDMRKELSEQEKGGVVFDPNDEAAAYLQMKGGASGIEGKKSPTQALTGNETMKEIFEIAVNAEKESITFYTSLKDLVSSEAGKDKVEAIIEEEKKHVDSLLEQLEKFE